MTFKGVSEDVVQRLPLATQWLFFATQGQTYGPMFDEKITDAAWQSKPSRVPISSNDRTLPPKRERAEVDRLHAIGSITLPTGHMSVMEDPGKVAAFNMAAMAASTK